MITNLTTEIKTEKEKKLEKIKNKFSYCGIRKKNLATVIMSTRK